MSNDIEAVEQFYKDCESYLECKKPCWEYVKSVGESGGEQCTNT